MLDAEPISEIAVEQIAPNPDNPRKRRDAKRDRELADSVSRHGVLQPILVRPNPAGTPEWQIVIGERRWSAARAAGLETIPARWVQLADPDCIEIMLIENGQRDDLDPVEEAQTYHRLHTECGLSLSEIAARVSKAKSTVHQRVRLMDAHPAVLKALAEGHLELSVAELIARAVAPSQHEEILEEVAGTDDWSGHTYREVKAIVEHHYTLRLADVPWKLDDAELIRAAGACTVCPKRTGAQPELFTDGFAADRCVDRDCYNLKMEASRDRAIAEAAASGAEVLAEDAAQDVLDRRGSGIKASSGFVDIAQSVGPPAPGKRVKSIKQALGKRHLPPVTIVPVPGSSRYIEVAKKSDVTKALKAKGIEPRKPAKPDSPEAAARKRARVATAIFDAQIGAVVAAIGKKTNACLPSGTIRELATELIDAVWADASDATARRRGLGGPGAQPGRRSAADAALRKTIEGSPPSEVLALCFELLLQRHRPHAGGYGAPRSGKLLEKIARDYKVDLAAVSKETKANIRALGRRGRGKTGTTTKRAKARARKAAPKAASKPQRKKR